jgi:hypothetical protein
MSAGDGKFTSLVHRQNRPRNATTTLAISMNRDQFIGVFVSAFTFSNEFQVKLPAHDLAQVMGQPLAHRLPSGEGSNAHHLFAVGPVSQASDDLQKLVTTILQVIKMPDKGTNERSRQGNLGFLSMFVVTVMLARLPTPQQPLPH